jgi:hypothetical protein
VFVISKYRKCFHQKKANLLLKIYKICLFRKIFRSLTHSFRNHVDHLSQITLRLLHFSVTQHGCQAKRPPNPVFSLRSFQEHFQSFLNGSVRRCFFKVPLQKLVGNICSLLRQLNLGEKSVPSEAFLKQQEAAFGCGNRERNFCWE